MSKTFQDDVKVWTHHCFGKEIAENKDERNARFLEEALELVQACGFEQQQAYALVDYVYGRKTGEKSQEVGGVLVTLAALCNAHYIAMAAAGRIELVRAFDNVDKIREKQRAKPQFPPEPYTEDI